MDTLPELLTRTEAAALLQVHPSTVTRLAAAGRLPVVAMTGRVLRYPLAAVRDLMATIRAKSDLTTAAIAQAVGVTYSAARQMERGEFTPAVAAEHPVYVHDRNADRWRYETHRGTRP